MALAVNTSDIAAIGTYNQLLNMLEDWEYEDVLDTQIPDFIRLVEARINRNLRAPEMEALVTLNAVDGVVKHPLDMLEARRVTYGGKTLRYISPTQYMDNNCITDTFTLIGDEIHIPSGMTGQIKLLYWKQLTALKLEQQTNFIIEKHPDVYFYGCMAAAEKRSANNNEAAQYNQMFESSLAELITHSNSKRHAGPMRMSGLQQVGGVRI